MIRKFNESKNDNDDLEFDIKYILVDLIDMGFKLELSNKFFTEIGDAFDDVKPDHKTPGYLIKLILKNGEVTPDFILNVTKLIPECVDRLSEYGDAIINTLKFTSNKIHEGDSAVIAIYLIHSDKSEDVSDKDGFYEFYEAIRRAFKISFNNKITRAFDFEQTKDGVLLKAKEDTDSKQILPETRRFINKFFEPRVRYAGRPNWRYKYDIKLVDNNIQVNYIGRVDV